MKAFSGGIVVIVVVLLSSLGILNAQQAATRLYGRVQYATTRVIGTTQMTPATTDVGSDPYAAGGADQDYYYRQQQQQYQTPDPYTYDPYSYQYAYTSPPEYGADRYGSSASVSQSQSGRNVAVGGSASASSSGQYDSRYSQQQQRPYDSRYSQGSGQASASRYPQQGYDSRYSQAGRNDPRYNVNAYQPPAVDYSQYPPTVKTLVLSESSIYVWWTDPVVQNAGAGGRRATKSPDHQNTKYTVKYSKISRNQADEQPQEETTETESRDLHLKTLESGSDYSFSVKINRNGQETGWSAPVNNRTLEPLPLGPPTNIRVVPTDRDATITLSPPEGLKGTIRSYVFLYAASGGSGRSEDRKWEEVQIPGGYAGSLESSSLIPRLQPGEEYFYTVQAINSRGSSPWSEIQSFKTNTAPSYGSGAAYPYPSDPYAGRDPYGRESATRSPYESERGYESDYYAATTPDRYARYRTTAYPGYRAETPDYYGRQQTTDYYARFATTPDYYGEASTSLGQTVTAPYWASAVQGGVVEPPSDVQVQRLDDPSEALISFTPSASGEIAEYEILYTYDPNASDDLWQIETAPGGESQAILVRLTSNTRVYVKMRAKNYSGVQSSFSDTVPFDTQGPSVQDNREGYPDAGNNAQGEYDHQGTPGAEEDHTDGEDVDPDTAHARTNRT